jgi:hypothetical protein
MLAHVAIVSDVPEIDIAMLTRVSAALQLQVTRDFGPAWGIEATVDAFARLEDVPVGYWHVVIQDKLDDPRALGYHKTANGQPYALVLLTQSWSLTASHEVLEMLGDPSGDRVFAGPSIDPNQGRVEYIFEVCDPCEGDQYAYRVNGVLVSDFYTPPFLGPETEGVRYSFTGALEGPRSILPGGYISWFDPQSEHVFQQTWFGDQPEIVDLSEQTDGRAAGESLREFVDRNTSVPILHEGIPEESPKLQEARAAWEANKEVSAASARLLRAEIDSVSGGEEREG